MKRNPEFDNVLFSEEYYNCNDLKLHKYQYKCIHQMDKFNKIPSTKFGLLRRKKLAKKMFGKIGDNCYIEPPIHANFGGKNTFIGDNLYANFNLTLVDDGKITIGNDVQIGPNVTIVTAFHPTDPKKRLVSGTQKNLPVTIGNNVWIGANATILPGVRIGDNVTIGAGAVVTKDVSENVVVAGVPARVIKEV